MFASLTSVLEVTNFILTLQVYTLREIQRTVRIRATLLNEELTRPPINITAFRTPKQLFSPFYVFIYFFFYINPIPFLH